MTAAAKIAEALTVHMVGVDLEPDDLPDGNVVVLTGSQDAVKAAAQMFGQQVKLSTDLADALAQENAKLRGALRALHHAVCGETGFAEAVRLNSGIKYPWPALDAADEQSLAALGETP